MSRKCGIVFLTVASSLVIALSSMAARGNPSRLPLSSSYNIRKDLAIARSVQKKIYSELDDTDIQSFEQSEPSSEEDAIPEPVHGTYLGKFRITHYCPCSRCNGSWNTTASGAPLTPGVTIAVDTSIIPLGAEIEIEGYGYRVAQDTGGAIRGERIDVLVDTHDEAMALGVSYCDVWIY